MRILGKIGLTCATLSLMAYLPVASADYVSQQEFAANGSVAQTLENSIDNYLLPYEVQQIGNAVYNAGKSYGALGNEITSSTPQMDFVSKHISGYCSPNIAVEATAFSCTGQAQNLNNDTYSAQLLEMGDIRTSVLLDPLTYTTVIDLAAQNFIRNITMPFPTQIFANYITNTATFAKNTVQRRNYATYLANQALLGVARYALDEMYGMRLPGSTLGASGNAASKSIMSVMENEASRRFTDPAYASFLTSPSTDQVALLREIAAMHAFDLWMQYQTYRQNERMTAILSAMLSTTVNTTITQNTNALASGVSQ